MAIALVLQDITSVTSHKAKQSMKVNLLLKAVQIMAFMASMAGFAFTSFELFVSYISDQTMISSSLIQYPEGMLAPEILICNKTAYKKYMHYMTELDYLQNTLQLEDFFVSLQLREYDASGPINSINYSIAAINTIHRGRCYIFQIKDKLDVNRMIRLKIKSGLDLIASILSPEELVLIVIDVLDEMPYSHAIGQEEGLWDFAMQKLIYKNRESSCENYSPESGRKGEKRNVI